MDRIWANRLEAETQKWEDCPSVRKPAVDAILRQDVENEKITIGQYEKITGMPYINE